MPATLKTIVLLGALTSLPASLSALPAHPPGAGPRHATVTVHNTRPVPVVVYVDRGPFDVRLATVAPHSEQEVSIPATLEGGSVIQLFVHPEGGRDLATPDLDLKPGENLDVYVPLNDVGFMPPPPPEVILNPGVGTTTVTVQNHRAEDVTLFVERGEFDIRVGAVPAGREETLNLPRSVTEGRQEVQLFVHPERGFDLVSQSFELDRGAHLFVNVPAR